MIALLMLPALLPVPAAAVVRTARVPAPAPVPVRPRPLTTVDHPPVDNAGSFDAGSRSQGLVALTFDADMTTGMLAQLKAGQVRSWYNQELRDLLDAEHVRATIFLTGLWAETYPEVARSLALDPNFEIGNHTYDHRAFRTPCYALSGGADPGWEVAHSQDVIAQVTGVRPTLLRFPGDCYDRSDQAAANQAGLAVISGDVRAGDGFNPSAAGIAGTVLGQIAPGSIVVMHFQGGPNAPMTAPAVRAIVQAVRGRGLDFGTVSEVLGRVPAAAPPQPATASEVLAPYRAAPLSGPDTGADLALSALRQRPLLTPRRPRIELWSGLLA